MNSEKEKDRSVSHYDFFVKNKIVEKKKGGEKDDLNSLGISESEFRSFMKKWKKKNFSS
jgi:transcriptional regulator with AAA-type ATPase domain